MRFSVLAAPFLAALANAVLITSPTLNELIDLSKGPFTVTWTTVSTDPTTAHLTLANQAGGHTQFSYDFGEVTLSAGKYTVTKLDIPTDTAYQFRLVSVIPTDQGILAASNQFNITGTSTGATLTLSPGASTSASPATGTTSTATAAASTTESGSSESTSTSGSSDSSTLTTETTSTATSTSSAKPSGNAANPQAVRSGSMLALLVGAVAAMV